MDNSGPTHTVTKIPAAPTHPEEGVVHIPEPSAWQEGRLILFLSGCTWHTSGAAQRPVALARTFGQRGYNVMYYGSGNYDLNNYWCGGPLVVNYATLQKAMPMLMQCRGAVILGLTPPRDIAFQLQRVGWTVVYDIIDDWEAFRETGYATWYELEDEIRCMRRADVVTASAPRLVERTVELTGRRPHLIRNAGPSRPLPKKKPPRDLLIGQDGTVVYSGYMQGTWFDLELLTNTIKELPNVGFNIIGEYDKPLLARNVNMLGSLPYPEAMEYVAHCDVGIIPFRHKRLCEAVDPIKYYDYAAGGLWTVGSSVMTDLKGRPWTILGKPEARSLAREIKEALQRPRPTDEEVAAFVAENSWQVRTDEFIQCIEGEANPWD